MFNLLPSAPRMMQLIYADWLEEHDNSLKATAIRQNISDQPEFELNDISPSCYGDGSGWGWGFGCGDGRGCVSGCGQGEKETISLFTSTGRTWCFGSADGFGNGNGSGIGDRTGDDLQNGEGIYED